MKTWLGLALVLLAMPTAADEVERGIKDVKPIVHRDGEARVLFRIDGSIDLGNVAVREASLHFTTQGEPERRRLNLRVHPVTTAWTPGAVDWTTGWTRPGGDFDDHVYASSELDLDGSATELGLDLTVLMKDILEEGRESEGFILTVDPADGLGLRPEDFMRLQGLSSATLEVRYRNVHPRRRGGQ